MQTISYFLASCGYLLKKNIVNISLNHSYFPLNLQKDDNLSFSLNRERKACPLTADSSFVNYQYKPGPGCSKVEWRYLLDKTLSQEYCYTFAINYPLDNNLSTGKWYLPFYKTGLSSYLYTLIVLGRLTL